MGKKKALTVIEMAQIVCKARKKPGIFLSFNGEPISENIKCAPYLDDDKSMQAIADGYGLVLCDSIKERDRLYDMTVGDEGPTRLNKYKGTGNVYALTISAKGELLNENT